MKLLITLLFASSISISTFAKSKVEQYFELGTSLNWNTETVTVDEVDEKLTSFTLRATKGYIFNKHWDVSLGAQYQKLAELEKQFGKDVKSYGVRLGVKYVFNKRPGFIKRHHKKWMTPYVGVAYQLTRLSPHDAVSETLVVKAKTEIPTYIVSAGIRCFMTNNLAIVWDLSYSTGKQITTGKDSGEEFNNLKVTQLNPSISFAYFY